MRKKLKIKSVQKKPMQVRKMTERQRKYRKNRLAGMTQYNASRCAGYSESYSLKACKIENRLSVKVATQDELERAGLTGKYLAKKLKALTDAGTTRIQEGETIVIPDNASRLKALELVYKLTGHLSSVQTAIQVNQGESSGGFFMALIDRAGVKGMLGKPVSSGDAMLGKPVESEQGSR